MTRPDAGAADPGAATAQQAAARAAERAGVRVAELEEIGDLRAAHDLTVRVWGSAPFNPPITAELMRAIGHAGGYVSGAWATSAATDATAGAAAAPAGPGPGGGLVGVCVGFLGRATTLHSHLCGVDVARRGRDIGYALKLHQRAWALQQGIDRIAWTFDPLVRRNAYFNLAKLGARPRDYLPDFYGAMADSLNAGDASSDRLLVEWPLRNPQVVRASTGTPLEIELAELLAGGAVVGLDADERGWPQPGPTDGRVVLVRVPADVAKVRAHDPACGLAWRAAVRSALVDLMAGGGTITGFHRQGWYVVERREAGA
ncbi:MAG: hypothetical protein L0Y54_17715 [Sporichthyaceae bacterium]|nr:hypothetical protein [Sporichthyaceae bacterium]